MLRMPIKHLSGYNLFTLAGDIWGMVVGGQSMIAKCIKTLARGLARVGRVRLAGLDPQVLFNQALETTSDTTQSGGQ